MASACHEAVEGLGTAGRLYPVQHVDELSLK